MCYFHFKGHKLYVEHIRHQLKSIIFPSSEISACGPLSETFQVVVFQSSDFRKVTQDINQI